MKGHGCVKMADNHKAPTGTPGIEKLEYGTNNTVSFIKMAKSDFDKVVHIPTDTAATGAMIVVGVLAYALARKHGWGSRLVPGGRDSTLHNIGAWFMTVGIGLGAGVLANDFVLQNSGVRTPWNESRQRIQVDPSLLQRTPTVEPVARARKAQAVNPDEHAQVLEINPRLSRPSPQP